MNIVGQLEAQQPKQEPPAVRPGETVRVHVKVVEGEKERTQIFEGIVIAMSGSGNRA
ncbi:MAG TPA: 50S ribosomal protein L19, partial [Candidatus Binatia bacterium]|nr:50S ribosomal protein L19 [Candidatus Binatia bacterium]